MKILVTGANGQLGKCIKDVSKSFPEMEFVFLSRVELDITKDASISEIFNNNTFDYCINTAAYTNVEKAESDTNNVFLINAEAVKSLAIQCKERDVTIIQISTDYVFDGEKTTPYNEEDPTNPINVYGASKLKGEQNVQEFCEKYFILRTSWLYSQYGHNFYNSMIRFAKEGKDLKITTEQTGTPTNANDLARAILEIIKSSSNNYGIYHVSNAGETTWYGFAKEILAQTNQLTQTNLAKSDHYPTFAARPKYSVLDNKNHSKVFNNILLDWKKSLQNITTN